MKIKKNDGYVSIEYVIVMCFVMIFFLTIISFIVYLAPYYEFKGYTSELAKKIECNGGLTISDYIQFVDKLSNKGIDTSKLEINVKNDETGEDAMFIFPASSFGNIDDYVKKGETIYVRVKIPADGYSYGNGIFEKIGLKNRFNDYYGYEYYIVSERV